MKILTPTDSENPPEVYHPKNKHEADRAENMRVQKKLNGRQKEGTHQCKNQNSAIETTKIVFVIATMSRTEMRANLSWKTR